MLCSFQIPVAYDNSDLRIDASIVEQQCNHSRSVKVEQLDDSIENTLVSEPGNEQHAILCDS